MKKFAVALAILVSTAGAAIAIPPPVVINAGEFTSADANKDGGVSFDEARGRYPTLAQAIFNMADSDDDGVLDEGEFTQLKGLTGESSNKSSEPSPP